MDVEKLVNHSPIWDDRDEVAIVEPYDYIVSKPGKSFRSKLINVFNEIYEIPIDKTNQIATLVVILHNASLLIDDIEDNSATRRGIPTSHTLFGVPLTINSANYMYFRAMETLQTIAGDNKILLHDLMVIFNQEMINLHRGQGLDIYWRENLLHFIPDETKYYNMVMNKTGGLFRLTVRIMELLTDVELPHSLVPLSNLLGIIYQIRDDYQNLLNEQMIANKGLAEDISEGKLSFPIIHGLRYDQSHNETFLQDILRLRTDDIELKKKAVEYLDKQSHSLKYTWEKLEELSKLAKSNGYIPRENFPDASNKLISIVDYLSAK
ncbi:hypothetical protein ZYGR_0AK01710 [Zygosaccharomyces rouxii]|uniref:Geranylgeranyl pyrophosphate synthase n=1 Tax=Zygosaccharomyces rouxii TaxID=4956 RepID=A0A1Q3AD27_ZYGRO|nr:hypothetical protein ZYGR_0AK01710 [Zygosaccharomyces rouxii]